MGGIDPDVLPAEARAVLDRLNVRPVAEYVAERLGYFSAVKPSELSHMRNATTCPRLERGRLTA